MCLDLEKNLIIELKNELFEQKMEKKYFASCSVKMNANSAKRMSLTVDRPMEQYSDCTCTAYFPSNKKYRIINFYSIYSYKNSKLENWAVSLSDV